MPSDSVTLVTNVDTNLSTTNIGPCARLSSYTDMTTSDRGQTINARGIRQFAPIANARGKVDDARAYEIVDEVLSLKFCGSALVG